MTILEIIQAVAKNVGVDVPSQAVANTDREYVNLIRFSEEAAEELTRRVDWGALRATTTIIGTGTNDDFALPAAFSRLTMGNAVSASGAPVRGGISQDEWFTLTPVEGTPRYFRLGTDTMSFYPFPASAATVSVSYQSKNWCSNGSDGWTADAETPLVPADLVVKGTIWRFKRNLGQDFSDYLGEFEAALADRANFDTRARTP